MSSSREQKKEFREQGAEEKDNEQGAEGSK